MSERTGDDAPGAEIPRIARVAGQLSVEGREDTEAALYSSYADFLNYAGNELKQRSTASTIWRAIFNHSRQLIYEPPLTREHVGSRIQMDVIPEEELRQANIDLYDIPEEELPRVHNRLLPQYLDLKYIAFAYPLRRGVWVQTFRAVDPLLVPKVLMSKEEDKLVRTNFELNLQSAAAILKSRHRITGLSGVASKQMLSGYIKKRGLKI